MKTKLSDHQYFKLQHSETVIVLTIRISLGMVFLLKVVMIKSLWLRYGSIYRLICCLGQESEVRQNMAEGRLVSGHSLVLQNISRQSDNTAIIHQTNNNQIQTDRPVYDSLGITESLENIGCKEILNFFYQNDSETIFHSFCEKYGWEIKFG